MPEKSVNRAMVNLAVMSATVMYALDTTIVNIALPRMQSEFGATSTEIGWVLTSYIVASSIFMPLTGFLTDRLGQRKCLVLATTAFVITSALCGLAMNLSELVLLRIAQGISGAALMPVSQTIMTGIYELEERGKAMALWGLGVNLGPVMGPTLGGWLTEHLSWRWTFFINIPVGIIAVAVALRHIPDSPRRTERTMDWSGFVLLGLSIGALQFVLDRGSRVDWFDSDEIVYSTMLFAVSLALFMHHILRETTHPIFNPRIFLDRNFNLSTLAAMAATAGIYGSMIMLPVFMESLLEYPASVAGLLMSPRSLAVGVGMILVARLMHRLDARVLIMSGIVLNILGTMAMSRYTLEVDTWALVWPGLLQGLGVGLSMVPFSVLAYVSLQREHMAEASSMNNLLRSVGSAAGISIASTLFTRYTQQGWQQLGGYVDPLAPAVRQYLSGLHLGPDQPLGVMILAHEVSTQAAITAISRVYLWIAAVLVVLLPMMLWLRSPRQKTEAPVVLAE